MEQTNLSKFEVDALPLKNYLLGALTINILTILAVVLAQGALPPQIPLFYGLAEGEGQLAPKLFLIIPSFAASLVLVVNSLLSSLFSEEFIKKALLLAAIASTFFAVITTLKIMLLVGSF